MKKLHTYVLVIAITISCTNHYKSAENFYLLGNFELAKKEIKKIKESDSNYKEANILIEKIDSSYFHQALELYAKNDFTESNNLLQKISPETSYLTLVK